MYMLEKLLRCYRQEGTKGIMRAFIRRIKFLCRRIWRHKEYIIFIKSLDNESGAGECSNIIFRVAEESDIPVIIQQLKDVYEDDKQLRYLLSNGDLAIIGLITRDGYEEIFYISWLSCKDKLLLTLLGDPVETFSICHRRIWVPVKYRRQGLAEKGTRHTQRLAQQMGMKKIWAFVETDNTISCKMHQRLLYEIYGRLKVGSYLGFRYARFKCSNNNNWRYLSAHYV